MTNLYDRKFKIGRQGEQILNEEMHKIYESVKHLTAHPEQEGLLQPPAVLDGAFWHDRSKNELKYYDKPNDKFVSLFQSKFQITDQITNMYPTSTPVEGQLWISNDVLMYYSNGQWKPIKALLQDESQFNVSVFENFLFLSPLSAVGNTVIEDSEIIPPGKYALLDHTHKAEHITSMEGYAQAKTISKITKDDTLISAIGKVEKKADDVIDYVGDISGLLDYINGDPIEPIAEEFQTEQSNFANLNSEEENLKEEYPEEAKQQMLVPDIDINRVFIDNTLNKDYEETSKVCISYSKNYIKDKTPSLIHVNPGKLTKITKRLFKVDKENPAIHIHPNQTEYYGFSTISTTGKLLLPYSKNNQDNFDYEVQDDGIYLSQNATENFDYVLSVTYDFSWYKSYGKMTVTNSEDVHNSYFVSGYAGPINVFVQGFNLEDVSFDTDDEAAIVTTFENTSDLEVSALHTTDREYGFIRKVDLKNRGIVNPIKRFKNPLLFVAGEAMIMSELEFDKRKNIYYVPNATYDMMWSIIELYDEMHNFDMYVKHGYVTETNDKGQIVISYDPEILLDTDCPVLFIDGLLLSESDVIRDTENHTLTAYGLKLGQDFILLNDRYNYLYTDGELIPAIAVDNFSESLLYLNGELLCNSTATHTLLNEEEVDAVHNEIKMFVNNGNTYKIFDESSKKWSKISKSEINKFKHFVYGYNNGVRSVEILAPYDRTKDWLQIYAFNYANAIENPLIIRNVEVTEPTTEIETVSFLPQTGSLSVWLNGIRQYPEIVKDTEIVSGIKEDISGTKFYFPEPITGHVTYTVQHPEKGSAITSTRELLNHENVSPGMINLYKTKNSLYPGRVTVYINGIRQPQDSYTILDNYTLYFNDKTTMLIGNEENYPEENILVDNELKTMIHNESDKILVEVSMIEKQERTISIDKSFSYDINVNQYDLDLNILEPSDEIMIFTNGLFFGSKALDGYTVNQNKGVITITDPDTIHAISSNPLEEMILSNEYYAQQYKKFYGKEYEHKNTLVTLEWR